MTFWKDKKVLVTGGCGFIGSRLVERLVEAGSKVGVVDDLKRGKWENLAAVRDQIEVVEADLLDAGNCRKACEGRDMVMHLAAKIRGVGYNVKHHAEMFYSNALMNINMMEAGRLENVDRFLCISTVGIYPVDCGVPTSEVDGFKGEPEMSGFGYGWSGRGQNRHRSRPSQPIRIGRGSPQTICQIGRNRAGHHVADTEPTLLLSVQVGIVGGE